MTSGLTARLVLRYVAGYLLLKGLIPEDIAKMIEEDPELMVLVGGTIAAVVEWAYAQAKKRGWAT